MRKVAIALVSLLLVYGTVAAPANATDTAGQGDAAFNANFSIPLISGIDVRAAVAMADGRVLVGGVGSRTLLMLNSDGSSSGLAATFNQNFASFLASTPSFYGITSIALLKDKIVLGGNIPGLIMMLNEDGTTNGAAEEFNDNVAGKLVPRGPYYEPQGLLALSDGSLLVSGFFVQNIMMFNSDGTSASERASVFNSNVAAMSNPLSWYAEDMVEKSDGSIIVGGGFTKNIMMFSADGTTNAAPASVFNANVASKVNGSVRGIALDEANGAVTISGEFSQKVMRFNLDGSTSGSTTQSFNAAMASKRWTFSSWSILSNSDGSVLVTNDEAPIESFNLDGSQNGLSGTFNSNRPLTARVQSLLNYPGGGYLLGGGLNAGLGRINTDGSTSGAARIFNQNIDPQPNRQVTVITAFMGGYLLGGTFTGYLRMINEDGSSSGRASDFNANVESTPIKGDSWNTGVSSIFILDSGKILIGGRFDGFLRMLNPDGTTTGVAATFNEAISDNVPGPIKSIVELPNGSIVVGGYSAEESLNGGYVKLFNVDGSSTSGIAKVFNDNISINLSTAPYVINAMVVLEDGALIVGGESLSDAEIRSGYLRAFNFDGTNSNGVAGDFNEKAASTLDLLTSPEFLVLESTIRSVVILADGRIVFGGYYSTPGGEEYDGIDAGYLLILNSDGNSSSANQTFINNANNGVFNGEVRNITVSRDSSMVVVGDFENRVKRLNPDGTTDGDSQEFNANSAGELLYSSESAVLSSDGSVILGGTSQTTRNLYKIFGGGYPIARRVSANIQQSNSQSSPPETIPQPIPPQPVSPQPIPPQTIPSVKPLPATSLSVIFSSGSKDLVTRYQKNLKIMVEKSGLQAKYTVSASASMVRGLPRSYVARLASARAAKVRSYLLKLGVRSVNITTKAVVNKIGQPLATKITVE